jgi:hypothetical protein
MIETGAVVKGLGLLSSGNTDRLIIVVHELPGGLKSFAVRGDYPELIREELKDLGLRAEQFRVMKTPVRHPITLNEAKLVLGALSQGVSALLLSWVHPAGAFWLTNHREAAPDQDHSPGLFQQIRLDRWWFRMRPYTISSPSP